MNREDIIRMAREVGLPHWYETEGIVNEALLIKFANLVASAEREACAKVCEDAPEPDGADLAERIRARGNVATNDTSQKRVDKTSEIVHEPVAWVSSEELMVMRGNALGGAKDWRINVGLVKQENDVGLYTTPPQRTWVGLKDDDEIDWDGDDIKSFVRAIEAKLKEKNSA